MCLLMDADLELQTVFSPLGALKYSVYRLSGHCDTLQVAFALQLFPAGVGHSHNPLFFIVVMLYLSMRGCHGIKKQKG